MNAPGQESCYIWTSRNRRPSPRRRVAGARTGKRPPTREWATRSRASVVDDHTRLAYSEPLSDEKAPTVVGFTIRALQFYREYGITHIQEIMTDNHPGYTHSLAFQSPPHASGDQAPDHQTPKPPTKRQTERYYQTLKPK